MKLLSTLSLLSICSKVGFVVCSSGITPPNDDDREAFSHFKKARKSLSTAPSSPSTGTDPNAENMNNLFGIFSEMLTKEIDILKQKHGDLLKVDHGKQMTDLLDRTSKKTDPALSETVPKLTINSSALDEPPFIEKVVDVDPKTMNKIRDQNSMPTGSASDHTKEMLKKMSKKTRMKSGAVIPTLTINSDASGGESFIEKVENVNPAVFTTIKRDIGVDKLLEQASDGFARKCKKYMITLNKDNGTVEAISNVDKHGTRISTDVADESIDESTEEGSGTEDAPPAPSKELDKYYDILNSMKDELLGSPSPPAPRDPGRGRPVIVQKPSELDKYYKILDEMRTSISAPSGARPTSKRRRRRGPIPFRPSLLGLGGARGTGVKIPRKLYEFTIHGALLDGKNPRTIKVEPTDDDNLVKVTVDEERPINVDVSQTTYIDNDITKRHAEEKIITDTLIDAYFIEKAIKREYEGTTGIYNYPSKSDILYALAFRKIRL